MSTLTKKPSQNGVDFALELLNVADETIESHVRGISVAFLYSRSSGISGAQSCQAFIQARLLAAGQLNPNITSFASL